MPRLNPAPSSSIRFDEDSNLIRSCFDPGFFDAPQNPTLSNSDISDEFLTANADLFNLTGIDLILTEEKTGSSQATCKYEQYHNNIPVYGAYLNVTLRKSDRRVLSSVNKAVYDIPTDLSRDQIRISSEDALRIMHEKYDSPGLELTHSKPVLFIFRFRLAWRIEADTLNPKGFWELFIDAVSGEWMAEFDRRRFYGSSRATIFSPDPVTSSQNPALHWGSPDDELDKELEEVLLENLDEPQGSLFTLTGKWVRIEEIEGPESKLNATGKDFIYSSKSRNFLSVMAYYYLDRLMEWMSSLDIPVFNRAITEPIRVDAQAVEGEDNSHFVAPIVGPVYLAFGEGGTPDASDPGVIVHEFGHALHYFLMGGLVEPGSFEEGFNDFLSCVFRDRFNLHGFDRANPFPWDNNSTVSWDVTRRCDMEYRFDDPGYTKYGFYKKGTVYASVLWDIYLEMGGHSDKPEERLRAAGEITGTCIDMLLAVGDTSPILDLANGLISSDKARTDGQYENIIRDAFRRRGLW